MSYISIIDNLSESKKEGFKSILFIFSSKTFNLSFAVFTISVIIFLFDSSLSDAALPSSMGLSFKLEVVLLLLEKAVLRSLPRTLNLSFTVSLIPLILPFTDSLIPLKDCLKSLRKFIPPFFFLLLGFSFRVLTVAFLVALGLSSGLGFSTKSFLVALGLAKVFDLLTVAFLAGLGFSTKFFLVALGLATTFGLAVLGFSTNFFLLFIMSIFYYIIIY